MGASTQQVPVSLVLQPWKYKNQHQATAARGVCLPSLLAEARKASAQQQQSIFPWYAGFLALEKKKKKELFKGFIAPFHLIFNVQEVSACPG